MINIVIASDGSRGAITTAVRASGDIPVESLVAVVALDENHDLKASIPDPDALAEILFMIQDALGTSDDGTIDTVSSEDCSLLGSRICGQLYGSSPPSRAHGGCVKFLGHDNADAAPSWLRFFSRFKTH